MKGKLNFFKLIILALAIWLFVMLSVSLTGSWLPVWTASAQGTPGEPTADEVNAIAKKLYCPVCENIPLDVCGTTACEQWRELIREKLRQGWSEDQIIQYFVDQYGDRVRATPPARGLNWLLYIVPPLAIMAGVYILYRAMRSWKQPLPQGPAGPPLQNSDDEYVHRLEEELKKR